ncbi:methylated-DNA--[protein]-cysteine S-methyltransferase [Microbacterium sp. LRZ72]|uniref:methylated-DNA--[protein]-cysteine S-methyltransferase n=1 Tax=Microbacterium sp. LRZ72 TaxID=2942481 RepID=UPI0029A92C3F|nr:methylated-DNA--[protein]-cysteine S-methyltransferase [Microbacterium sp. LRZ72]MDX2375995.1 methylated-DNA--[protein]-cysteine S-methyltransferase [Microbacterium sp. LRZ72]
MFSDPGQGTARTASIETLDTPDGAFTVIVDDRERVLASGWSGDPAAVLARLRAPARPARVVERATDAAAAVRAYYAGEWAAVAGVPVVLSGTALQVRGWEALRRIEPGRPLTYAAFAAACGVPTAVRAAASVCARNAPALFVPCHRVRRADGDAGGFAWGAEVKRALLDREAAARVA